MKRFIVGLIAIYAFAVSGNGAVVHPLQQGMTQAQMTQMMQMMQPQACPMKVQGADVAVSDTKDGAALTFSAKSKEDVTELRKRVQQMASMHESMSGMPMGQGQMPPFSTKYEETTNGARLTLTPKDPAKLADFRKQVAAHADHMKRGDCASMMQEMMHGMMTSQK